MNPSLDLFNSSKQEQFGAANLVYKKIEEFIKTEGVFIEKMNKFLAKIEAKVARDSEAPKYEKQLQKFLEPYRKIAENKEFIGEFNLAYFEAMFKLEKQEFISKNCNQAIINFCNCVRNIISNFAEYYAEINATYLEFEKFLTEKNLNITAGAIPDAEIVNAIILPVQRVSLSYLFFKDIIEEVNKVNEEFLKSSKELDKLLGAAEEEGEKDTIDQKITQESIRNLKNVLKNIGKMGSYVNDAIKDRNIDRTFGRGSAMAKLFKECEIRLDKTLERSKGQEIVQELMENLPGKNPNKVKKLWFFVTK